MDDSRPGIRRRRAGRHFSYIGLDGRPIRDAEELQRIRSVAIPPAWTDVWICADPSGHIQATGRDAKGRKQYRYHARWREIRDETKYGRMATFARALPSIRARVQQDLAQRGLPREKVLAAVIRLLETTFIRVGNEEYARSNKSFGLTTMRDRHVDVNGSELRFRFRGKSGKEAQIGLRDRRLARIVKQCQDLPGQHLFQYVAEDGTLQTIDSADVNEYLRETTGEDFTAKDFRTWAGTVLAAEALRAVETVDSDASRKRDLLRAIEEVASSLGNTPSVCRKCYIHPAVLDAYLDGSMAQVAAQRAEQAMAESLDALRPEETAVLELLQQRLERVAATSR